MAPTILKNIPVEYSFRGEPCLWEQGGARTNTGFAILVANSHGYPKRPLFVRSKGIRACDNHALVPVHIGDYVGVFEWRYSHKTKSIVRSGEVYRIDGFDPQKLQALLTPYSAEQNPQSLENIRQMVDVGWKKAEDYHCRKPYYVQALPPKPKPFGRPAPRNISKQPLTNY